MKAKEASRSSNSRSSKDNSDNSRLTKVLKVRYVIILLLIAGFAIKCYPPLTHDFLVNFDSIYHTRIGQIVADTGFVPSWDPVMGGRPHLYPPLYHLLLGYTSRITGVPVFDIVQYMLPFASALFILPVFFLVRKYRDSATALWAAAFMALSPIVASQSYDSPEVFGLLLFPLIAYWFLKGNYFIGGGLLAICVLFNYGVVITIGSVLAIFAVIKIIKDNDRRFLIYALLIAAIGIGLASPWLLVAASRMGQCFEAGVVSSVNNPGVPYLWEMMPFFVAIGLGLLYLTRAKSRFVEKKRDDYLMFWRTALGIATIGFVVSLFVPQLHPYDQIMLLGFSMPFLLAELRLRKEYKMAIVAIMLIGMFLSVLAVKPALSSDDVAAVNWIKNNVHEGNILANLEVAGTINMLTMNSRIVTSFDQFLECVPNKQRWIDLNQALATRDAAEARSMLDKYQIDYIVVGARDTGHYNYDTEKFAQMGMDKVFNSGESIIYKVR